MPHIENRTLLLLTVIVIFVAALWWTSRAPGRLVGEQTSGARVVAVELRQRGPDKQLHTPVLVTVELADGGRARLWMPRPGPAVEQKIQVLIRHYDDGTRRIRSAR